jgi:hypothetical protein
MPAAVRAFLVLAVLARGAAAQEPATTPTTPTTEPVASAPAPASEPATSEPATSEPATSEPATSEPVGDQDLGVRFGGQLGIGGPVAPGGLRVGGEYLLRMTERSWAIGAVGFTYGAGGPDCYRGRDPDRSLVCATGVASGFSGRLGVGGRFFPAGRDDATSAFLEGGLAIDVNALPQDSVVGVGPAVWIGFGLRIVAAERVALVGTAHASADVLAYERIGVQGGAQIVVDFGVEFGL